MKKEPLEAFIAPDQIPLLEGVRPDVGIDHAELTWYATEGSEPVVIVTPQYLGELVQNRDFWRDLATKRDREKLDALERVRELAQANSILKTELERARG
jgi:hypothetical protein